MLSDGNEIGHVIYGEVDEFLIALPEVYVVEQAEVRRALRAASTWGELRRRVAPSELRRIEAWFDDEDLPPDDAPFDLNSSLPAYLDGDYPDWPAQAMLQLMPAEIVERYVTVLPSWLNGDSGSIAMESEAELVAALDGLGYRARRDDALIQEISGYTPGGS